VLAATLLMASGCGSSGSAELSTPQHDDGGRDATFDTLGSQHDTGPVCGALPAGATYVDPAAPFGREPDTATCTRLVRVASAAAVPAIAAANPGKFPDTFTYLYRADDGTVVMIDGGFTIWVTGGTATGPMVEENVALRETLDHAVGVLAAGRTLADVSAVYFEHGHPDHTMQAKWVQQSKGAPLDIWMGQGDVPLVQSSQAVADCTGQLPAAAVQFVPIFDAPNFVIHPVPTSAVAAATSAWVDGGHGVWLIAAPSHTYGTLLVYIPSLNVVIASNHLRHGATAASNDCSTDASTCKTDCSSYWQASTAIPSGARVLHVHREDISGGGG